ncbi:MULTISPECIES: hypothetical protein [Rhodopseudomonas]|uniref:hypothetical protein n=1 Tax=Rhodopseudomonas TaxID=1073 RepID=UPI00069663BC
MANAGNDPVALWQTMLGEMEKGFNAFAHQAMGAAEFSKVVDQVGGVSAGAQKQLGNLMEKYLTSLNMPSRAQMANFGERLTSIESQLGEITTLLRQTHTPAAPTASTAPATSAAPATSVAAPAASATAPAAARTGEDAPAASAASVAQKQRGKRPPEQTRK